jgi:Cytochrome P460
LTIAAIEGPKTMAKIRAPAMLSVVALTLCAVLLISLARVGRAGATDDRSPAMNAIADAEGGLRVPADYRSMYEYLGSWAIAADQGQGSKQLHSVYASPGAVAAFRTNGHFPDGAVLVKEVYETATSPMTTGTVSHAETLAGWFVMVKDGKNSHPQNKLWGSGWAWSWFDAANPSKTTSTDYTTDCQPCHIPAQSTDWIYTQGYPVLRK